MGYGGFDPVASSTRAAFRASTGTSAFIHSTAVKSGTVKKALHNSLDPNIKNFRECRDSVDNPESIPIAIFVDETGSMSSLPPLILAELGKAVSVIQASGVKHPSILFGAIGDAANNEQAPLQVGEFEASDELCEQHLANIYLEGNGGGNDGESYDLAMWFVANAVKTDHWEKRGRKGFMFIIGDEPVFPVTKADWLTKYVGQVEASDVDIKTTASKLQEQWEVWYLNPHPGYNTGSTWKSILPAERVVNVPDYKDLLSLIAGHVAVISGAAFDDTMAILKSAGLSTSTTVSNVLASSANSVSLAISGGLADLAGAGTGTTRL